MTPDVVDFYQKIIRNTGETTADNESDIEMSVMYAGYSNYELLGLLLQIMFGLYYNTYV